MFPERGRVPTNNAASTQPPVELLDLYKQLAADYENVHRGQSDASRATTKRFEESYDTIANFINAPGRENLVITRNATEAHNTLMYCLLTEFRDGDNVVATMMEHNSNYVPWYGMCKEILPKFGIHVECRLTRFDPETGELDPAHLRSLVDSRTKLVTCTGASNFLGTKNDLPAIREISRLSGYQEPGGERGSLFLVDGAQLVPGTAVDVQELDVDFLTFSFHKILAPLGVGVLYAKRQFLDHALPFLYGGDMIAEGEVRPDYVGYNRLPWKYSAGTPNILGTIVSAQALRLLLDLALHPDGLLFFGTSRPLETGIVREAMKRIAHHTRQLTQKGTEILRGIKGITIYGPEDVERRASLLASNVKGHNPMDVAEALNARGVESRAGCHCATLAHHFLELDPPASCRLSFYFCNSPEDAEFAASSARDVVA